MDDQFDPIINHIKGSLTPRDQLDLKLTFFSIMVEGRGGVTKAQLKRDLASLSHDLCYINLQIQQIRQGQPNPNQIASLQQVKLKIQQEVVGKEVQLELLKAQCRRRRRGRCKVDTTDHSGVLG